MNRKIDKIIKFYKDAGAKFAGKGFRITQTQPNIMKISGWLPVSFNMYMTFFEQIGDPECYCIAKYVADTLNDKPKYTNKMFIKDFYDILELREKRFVSKQLQYINAINSLIDFIRDSFTIYYDIIKEERQNYEY